MSGTKADEARFLFKLFVGSTEFGVLEFEGREELSKPFFFEIKLVAEDYDTDPADLVHKKARLTFATQRGAMRHINGMIFKASLEEAGRIHAIYRVELRPWHLILNYRKQSRIFQKKTVEEIVTKVLEDAGFPRSFFEFDLGGSYKPREYCVQYRETDLEFITRILSEEGMFYLFRHEPKNEIMRFGDDGASFIQSVPESQVVYHPVTGRLKTEEEVLYTCSTDASIYSGKSSVSDYNWKKPHIPLKYEDPAKNFHDLELYDHPAGFNDLSEGAKVARRLKQAASCKETVIRGKGDFRCLSAGHKITISGHANQAVNRLHTVLEVEHKGRQTQVLPMGGAGAEGTVYEASFSGVPAVAPVQPDKVISKPSISIQSAKVVGPSGQEIYTDEHGRVKIQFYWDREGKNNQDSSCWVRVSQVWAGRGFGAMFIPRIGQEVLVDFLEGDPDRPVIIGRVYNGSNTAPLKLPGEKTKSTIKSRSTPQGGSEESNEIRFEDKKGQEEIYLHGQKDWTIKIKNDKNQTVDHDETMNVGNNRTKTVKANQSEKIGENKTIDVGKDHAETINNNKTLSVVKNHTESIGENQDISVGKNRNVSVGDNLTQTVGADKSEDVGKNLNVHAADKINVTGDTQVMIKSGSAVVTIKQDGKILIEGASITAKASGNIVLKGSKVFAN